MEIASYAPIFQLCYTPSLTWLQHDGPLSIGAIQGKEHKTCKDLIQEMFFVQDISNINMISDKISDKKCKPILGDLPTKSEER